MMLFAISAHHVRQYLFVHNYINYIYVILSPLCFIITHISSNIWCSSTQTDWRINNCPCWCAGNSDLKHHTVNKRYFFITLVTHDFVDIKFSMITFQNEVIKVNSEDHNQTFLIFQLFFPKLWKYHILYWISVIMEKNEKIPHIL